MKRESSYGIRVAVYIGVYILAVIATMYSYLGDIHPYWWQPGGENDVDPDVALGALIFSVAGSILTVIAGLILRKSWVAWVGCAVILLFAVGRMIAAAEAIAAYQ